MKTKEEKPNQKVIKSILFFMILASVIVAILSFNVSAKVFTIQNESVNMFIVNGSSGNIILNPNFGYVGINTTTPNQALTVVGNANITGSVNITSNLDARGDIALGDTSSDTLNVNAYVGTDFIPTDNIRDLGSSANRWRTGYFDNVDANNLSAGNASISGTTSDTFTIFTNSSFDDTRDVSLAFERGTPVTNAVLKWDSTNKFFNFNFPVDIAGNLSVDTDVLFADGTVNRVGIGTATPSHTLTVVGDLNVTGGTFIDALNLSNDLRLGNAVNITSSTGDISLSGNIIVGGYANISGDLNVNDNFNVTASSGNAITSGDLYVLGNVGIGTGSPAEKLHVIGNVNVSGMVEANTINATERFVANNTLYVNGSRVGIGTASPIERLEVSGNVKLSGNVSGTNFNVNETSTAIIMSATGSKRLIFTTDPSSWS